ncbi:MAG: Holliday junction resolvase RuvX [Planctomycetes bacterium]|nr:Holliday junction resolvase RuvX [Planctomycetota bacterium]
MKQVHVGRWIGVDYGSKHVGVAICDEYGMFSHPVDTFEAQPQEKLIARLIKLAREEDADGFVVGMPFNMDGSEGKAAKITRMFAEALKKADPRKVELFDERLSSWEAEGKLMTAGMKPPQRRKKVHAVAAQIILSSFVERRKAALQAKLQPSGEEE